MEWLKDLSDRLIIWFLRATSGFNKELTMDGKREQEHWREQRIRNLRGLALRSQQRLGKK
jgi:very-short-patch-repair endonuclease